MPLAPSVDRHGGAGDGGGGVGGVALSRSKDVTHFVKGSRWATRRSGEGQVLLQVLHRLHLFSRNREDYMSAC